jgi:O-antigen/teichoic acid export membrane protein
VATNNTKQAAWVAIGSLFSFAVGVISPMILSRFFTVGDYGTYKQVMYVYTTLLSVFTIGLPKAYAYFLPKYSYEQSKAIINKITSLFLLLGILFCVMLFLGAGTIANLLGNPELTLALRVFSPVPLFLLPTMGLDGIFATYQKTQFLALYTIITKITTILLTVLPVIIFKGNYIYAIIGFDIASILTCITALALRSLPIKQYPKNPTDVSYTEILNFSVPLLFASIWGMLYTSVNQFFVSRFFGKEAFAIFSNGFTELPFIGMVVGSISTVLLPVFSRLEKGGSMSGDMIYIWNSAMLKSAKILFPISIFSIFMAHLVMICLYGGSYEGSTIYFQIKNIYGLFYIVPFAPLLIAMGKTSIYSNITMYFTFLLITLDVLCINLFDSPIYIAIVSEACSIVKIIVFFIIIAKLSYISVSDILPLKQLIYILAVSVVASLPTYFVSTMLSWNKFCLLLCDVLLFCVFYYTLCRLGRISYKNIVSSITNNNKILKYIP